MGELDIVLLVVLITVPLIGAGIFFLSGIYVVKKDYSMIVERNGEFFKEYKEGRYFLFPIAYKRKALFHLVPLEIDIRIEGLREMVLGYQIVDPVKYYYSKVNIVDVIKKAHLENEEMSEEILINSLGEIGIKYISISLKK